MATRKIAPSDFECEAAYAPVAYPEQGGARPIKSDAITKLLEQLRIKNPLALGQLAWPVALRWRTTPNLGLPIEPFRIWRKVKKSSRRGVAVEVYDLIFNKVALLNGPFFRLHVSLKNDDSVDRIFRLQPLDAKYNLSGSKTFSVFVPAGATSFVIVDQPNTAGLVIEGGNSTVTSITGITMLDYLNDPAWELIQIVGLPFGKGNIDPDLYDTQEQGFVDSLIDPESACIQRTDLYRNLYKDPIPVASDGTVLPTWKVPLGIDLLTAYQKTAPIKNGKTGTLADIEEMLHHVYQIAPSLYNGMQRNYFKTVESLGVVDPANPNPNPNGRYKNPVCSATLMSAASDCWHALGLGFGTTDFLPSNFADNGGFIDGLNDFDYMVTAVFEEPVLAITPQFPFSSKPKFLGFNKQEYAALCHNHVISPPSPASLQAQSTAQNRPLFLDDHYYDAVRISWQKAAVSKESPLCYAIAFRNNLSGGNIQFLNSERPFIPGHPQPYVPSQRADAEAEDLAGIEGNTFERFFHDRSPVPFIGSIGQQYYAAAQNVFGLWSNWSIAAHTLSANPPQTPTIVSAKFVPRYQGVLNHIYPSDLEVVLNFDWDDRTPYEIHFGGYFLSAPSSEPPVTVPGITHSNSGGIMTRYRIRFSGDLPSLWKLNNANVLVPVNPSEGTVDVDNTFPTGTSNGQPNPGGSDSRAYRVILKQLELNFSTKTRLHYTLYARASEANNPALFSKYSNEPIPGSNPLIKGKFVVISASDPLPRNPPTFAPDIKWASLPDASNTSRYHLKFTPVPGTVGYAVYMATEMSLRDRLAGISNYPSNGSIFQRRDALNLASPSDKNRALDAFTRINKKMLTIAEVELAMNGDTGGLYIYAVSSFTDQNVESPLSDWIYVGIPERITPGPPTLMGFVHKKSIPIVNVLKVDVGAGKNTNQVELFRTDKRYLSNDINLMGLPYSVGPALGWQKFKQVNGLEVPVINPNDPFDYYKIEQPTESGWTPLYYRAVGIGLNQPGNGKMPGRSPSSNLLELLPPVPNDPPDLQDLLLSANASFSQLRLSFKSNAFVGTSPHGNHSIIVYQQNSNGLWDKITGGDIPALHKVAMGTEPVGALVRLQGAIGTRFGYAYTFPFVNKTTLKISVSDPLGRKTEQIISYKQIEDELIIKDIRIKKLAAAITVTFKTNVSKKPPSNGAYTLNIQLRSGNTLKSLLRGPMHKIPDSLPVFMATSAIAGGTTQDNDQFYTYSAVFKGTTNFNSFNNAKVLVVSITDPDGVRTESELKLTKLL